MDMTLINSDIALFKSSFPFVKLNWETISFVTHDECSVEYLAKHEGYEPKDKHPTFYSPVTNTVVHDNILILFDYVRYHEMGHVVNDKLLGYKRCFFSSGWRESLVKHWEIKDYRRENHMEVFADVFAETMLRLKNNCIMAIYNQELKELLMWNTQSP